MENKEEILNNENIQAEEINNVSEPKGIDIQSKEDIEQDTDDFENAVELPDEEEN